MDLTLKENVPGLLIFIDFQKAFDSLEWNFLLSCLEAFNFGPDFIRWVKTFYKNIQSTFSMTPLSFRIDNKDFDALKKKSKDYYLLIKSRKAQFPNNSRFLKHDFNLTDDQLKKVFILPHNLAFEPYVRAFQYKILNSILYTFLITLINLKNAKIW